MTNLNFDSAVNQSIKGDFVSREVLANVNSMVDYIIEQEDDNAPFTYEEIENTWVDNTEEIQELEEEIQELQDNEEVDENEIMELEDAIQELEDEQEQPRDWYESWLVSNWLMNKLRDKGEMVIPHMNIWLRQTTGQAIKLDYVISEICNDLDMLK